MAATALAVALMMPTVVNAPPPLLATSQETGFKSSAYQGDYYQANQETYRECVAFYEARHQYWTTGNNGAHLGTYQFTGALARGAVWMMAKEWAKDFGHSTAKKMRIKLHKIKPTKWSREIWDQAFYTVLNWNYPGSGEKHWAAQYGRCPLKASQ